MVLQQVLAQAQGRTNGHASPAPSPDDQATGFCSLHQAAMERRTAPESGDTCSSHYDDAAQRYCKGAKLPRRHGTSRR